MKAIIPVAGAGTQLRPLTYTQPKALIPLAGKTILSLIIDQLLAGGVHEFIFIIGYLGEKIENYIAQYYPDLPCSFVNQSDRKGTGHAIYLAKEIINNDEVLILFGDTICTFDMQDFLKKGKSQIGVKKVDDPRLFGVAEINDENRVTKVIEKPAMPKSNRAMVGLYYIKETVLLFEALNQNLNYSADADGEYSLTHALQKMIEKGCDFEAYSVKNWYDCGKKETLLTTNATLLKSLSEKHPEQFAVQQYTQFPTAVIIPPVSIADGCEIKNSIVGPHVSVGEHSIIHSSIIKESIIGSYAKLADVILTESIIGNDAFVHSTGQSLNIGDNTEIDL